MKFIKRFFVLSFALCFSFAAFAVDFGGLATNRSTLEKFNKLNPQLNQKNSLSVWIRQNFDKSGENYIAAETSYNFESDFFVANSSNQVFTNTLDFNLLKFAHVKDFDFGKFGLNAGRFYFSDLSGIVFVQNADGIKFDFQNDWVKTSIYSSYTGLLNALTSEMITSPATSFSFAEQVPLEGSQNSFVADTNKLYDLAQKYLIGAFSFSLPNLIANQTVSLEYLGAFRLENEKFNRMYASLSFDGPIYNSLFYNISTTFGFTNYAGENKISNLSKANIRYYLKNLSLGANAIYASGNQGVLSTFSGFTKNTSTYSRQSFLYSGIIKAGLNASYKPIPTLLLTADCDTIFNASAGSNFDKIEFFAFQYSVGALWQVKSDFQLGLTGYQFLDKANSDSARKSYVCLSASLAF